VVHVTTIAFKGSKMSDRAPSLFADRWAVRSAYFSADQPVYRDCPLSFQQRNKWVYKIAMLSVQVTVSVCLSMSFPEPINLFSRPLAEE
jgi:hypothetical protein